MAQSVKTSDANAPEETVVKQQDLLEALQRSKAEWETTFDAMSDWVSLLDVQTRTVVRTNRAGEAIVGLPLREIVGQHCCQLVHGTPEPIPDCPLTKMLQTHRRESVETRLPDGRWVVVTVDPVMDAEGNLVSTVHATRDITERKRAEEQIQYQATLLQQASDAIVATDTEYNILSWNRAAEALYGWRADEVLGRPMGEVARPEYPFVPRETVIKEFLEKGIWRGQVVHRRRDDAAMHILSTVSQIKDSAGNLVGAVAVNRDITERVQAEESLRESEEALRRHADRLRTLHEIDQAILEARSPEAIAEAALHHLRMLIPCSRASATTYDLSAQEPEATVLAVDSDHRLLLNAGKTFQPDPEMVAGLRNGVEIRVPDTRKISDPVSADRLVIEEGIRSFLNVPLIARGELIGSLTLGSEEPDAFGEEEIEIAREVAGPLAIALQQARLYEEARRHAGRMASVVRVGQALGTTLDIAKLYEIAYEQIGNLLDSPGFGLFTYDATAQLLHPMIVLGDGKPLDVSSLGPIMLEPETGPQSRAIVSQKPVIIPDIQAERDRIKTYKDLQTESRKPARSVLVVPLVIDEQVIGTVQLQSYQTDLYTEEDAQLLSGIANQLALALQNARLYEEARCKAEESAALLATAQAIASLDLDTVLNTIAAQVKALFQADGSRIHLVEPDGEALRCVVALHQRAERALACKLKLGEGMTGRVALRGEAEIVHQTLVDPGAIQMPGTPVEPESVALAPLKIRGQVMGVLTVTRLGEDRPFAPGDLAFLTAFANQATLSIRNARLYEEVQRHAEELEQRVAERTAELQEHVAYIEELNRALANLLEDVQAANRQAERMARQLAETNVELESFAYSVSHDLRAPLRAMQGFAEALLEDYGDRLDEVGQDYANRIVRATQRMDELIEDLLAYSWLGRVDVRLRTVSLGAVVAEALVPLETEIAQAEAVVVVEEPLPAVLAHHSTLVQVVTNLLTNAIKFVEPGVQPHVRIWAAMSRGAGEPGETGRPGAEEMGRPGDREQLSVPESEIQNLNWIRLWVEDNGIGIAPEHRERVFRVFERLHGIETYPGTGIGLAIVRKGVERMGGRVGIESEIGQGSRFWVELRGGRRSLVRGA